MGFDETERSGCARGLQEAVATFEHCLGLTVAIQFNPVGGETLVSPA